MPAELFRSVAVLRRSTARRLGAVPLSIAFHAALLLAIVTIPLVANNEDLPTPHIPAVLQLVPTPVIVVPSVPPPRSADTKLRLPDRPVVPLVPPVGIGPELAIDTTPRQIPELSPGEVLGSIDVGEALAVRDMPPPPSSPPKPLPPVKVGAGVLPPAKIHDQAPVYPSIAIQAHIEGTVVIEAIISTTGTVQNLRVVKSIPLLDAAAVEAVRQWMFTPTRLRGEPVPVILTVNVEFKLR